MSGRARGAAAFAAGCVIAGCSLTDLTDLDEGTAVSATSAASSSTSSAGATTASTVVASSTASSTGGGGDGGAGAGAPGSGGQGGSGGGGGGGGGGAPCEVGQACSLVEDFEEPFDETAWELVGSCANTVEGGRLVIEPDASASEFCFRRTIASYNLHDSSFHVAVPVVTASSPGVQTFFTIEADPGSTYVALAKVDDTLQLDFIEDAMAPIVIDAYDFQKHAFFKVSGSAISDVVTYSVRGPDLGDPWEEIASGDAGFPIDSVQLIFGVRGATDVTAPGQAEFDCLNTDPDDCEITTM